MKKTILFIAIGALTIFLMSSCASSQKRQQRKIERHGIKESVSFVIAKYPEYFKTKDTIIHDTTIIEKVIEVPTIDTSIVLSDSSDFYHYKSDSLSILINKLTGKLKLNIKPRVVYLHDTVRIAIKCPQIICPDCEDLKDYTKEGPDFKWWWLIVAGVVLGALYIWANRTK